MTLKLLAAAGLVLGVLAQPSSPALAGFSDGQSEETTAPTSTGTLTESELSTNLGNSSSPSSTGPSPRTTYSAIGTWVPQVVGECWADGYIALDLVPLPFPELPETDAAHPRGSGDGPVLFWRLIHGTDLLRSTFQNTCLESPPPAPPTTAEIWAAIDSSSTPLPDPALATSPETDGLVGVVNWYWYGDTMSVRTQPLTIRGWTIVATATVERVCWNPGSGDPAVCATDTLPGTNDEHGAAATHVYQRRGDYVVSTTATWGGTADVTGPGVVRTIDLGTVDRTGTAPYRVIERQAVVTG